MKKARSIFVIAGLYAAAFVPAGLLSQPSAAQAMSPANSKKAAEPDAMEHDVYGTVRNIEGSMVSLETRSKKIIPVDLKPAIEAHRSNVPVVGHSLEVRGTYDKKGVLHATAVLRAKDSPALWSEDK